MAATRSLDELLQDPGWQDWRWQMDHAVRSVEALSALLRLPASQTEALRMVAERYPVVATPYYLSLARTADRGDPVLAQVCPDLRELADCPDGDPDPLAEERDSPVPGLVHRYPDRALLVLCTACAVHCRHCMRKRAWGHGEAMLSPSAIAAAVATIRARPQIREVLVSGGDPLLLPDDRLVEVLKTLQGIPHVEMVRLGTRAPVVLPQRLTPEFCQRLGDCGPLWAATHFNHPHELTEASAEAALNLLRAGIPVVNQTVLLRGVNDDAETLRRLFTGLLRQRIKPYYLFHGDPVAGTMHFRTGVSAGLALLDALRGRVSGLALPAYAVDLPGGGGKVRLEPACVGEVEGHGRLTFRDYRGAWRSYPDA